MSHHDLMAHGEHVMTVCNACRYCEQYCPVFPAMENRLAFRKGDLTFLANLCHNCGECLYACQYAPPHEFGINVPKTLAEIRVQSYEDYCWPRVLGVAFKRHSVATSLGLAMGLTAVMYALTVMLGSQKLWRDNPAGDFYSVIPHQVMVALFGGVSLFVLAALGIGVLLFWRDIRGGASGGVGFDAVRKALSEALTLKHLHGAGADCTSAEEQRGPWRRRFHHFTFYGFALCFASTSVAALYHSVFGWEAPYGYTSLPVMLGTVGGIGLLVGPIGLFLVKQRRDPALSDRSHAGMDSSFLVLLWLTSVTGLLLLVLRGHASMGVLLIVHLGVVLALFVTLPYGKFVHGIYRTAALINHAIEDMRVEPQPATQVQPVLLHPEFAVRQSRVVSEQPISIVKVP